ncbi:rho guanine nucleotide exchange factor 5 isoform X2 [Erinaceus europaeus]|uniref:Rho guanine nucleotide exchange factor 5 isoform X2 n=1 Tax=Erinaceus europaeus TaxID=9365 RepID=A0A1S3WA95_ERIEU|nr:rho guanine nucleotide exchange factor 5 isoform X2 [Erinaceus europaeus]
MQIDGLGEAGWSKEVPETGEPLQGVGRKEEGEEHDGPSTLPLGPPAVSSPCEDHCPPIPGIPGIRTTPRPEALSPPPNPELGGGLHPSISLAGSYPAGESPNQETDQGSQEEGFRLRQGPLSGQGTKLASLCPPALPPRMPDSITHSPHEVSVCTPASPSASSSLTIPLRKPSPAVCSPETSRTSLSSDSPSPYGASEMPLSALHGFLATETLMDPWTMRQSPQNNSMGTVPHLRSKSFPGSHRAGSAPDLAGTPFSSSHSELPQKPPKPASYDSAVPRRDRKIRGHGCIIPESQSLLTTLGQDPGEFPSHPERPSSPLNPAFIPHSLACGSSPNSVTMDSNNCHPYSPRTWEKRYSLPSTVQTDRQLNMMGPTLKRCHHPPPLTLITRPHAPAKGPLPQAPDPLVARQLRPLPSTPDNPHHVPASFSPKLRYNKPLPPTPDLPQHPGSSASSPRIYKPLPPLPILEPPSEAPPLPPKTRGRSMSTLGGLLQPSQPSPKPVHQEWTVPSPHSAERTSWPPATSRTTEALVPSGWTKSEAASVLAFSNMTNLMMPSSPSTPWTQAEPGSSEESETHAHGSPRKTTTQKSANSLRRSEMGRARPEDRPSHPQLEKSSSWPHRRDPGRARDASTSGQSSVPSEGANKQKSWNRQGLRRPSILPEGMTDAKSFIMEKSPSAADTIVFREKKPKEMKAGFARRCSKLINSSQLLYQEYSDEALNKEIQSQQRLDSIAEEPGPASPRQPRKGLVSSESYLQRLSMVSSASLWQEIPLVRNSAVLLSMTHSDQKLQEAKFELIVSEASYLRSLHIAVDHFQHSSQLRATLSNQEHQWLFSRLQDVREVSTTFLSDLEENFENNIFTFQVCDVVLHHAPHFRRVYLPYVTNQTYQERTFQNLLSNNSSFREVLEKLESDPVCQRLSLKSFLILPFQRITRLKLLLQNILKRTQPGSSEEAEATKAHHALEELIRDCNSSVQKMHRTEELIHLSQKIEFECKIFPLISQSRWLVKSGELMALEFIVSPGLRRKLNTRPIHLHLFNDCLLLSRPREGSRFLVFDHAPFSSIRGEKCEMKLHGHHKNLFRLFLLHNTQGTQSEFLFSTETQSEKLRWLSALATPREELDLLECYDSPQVQCLRAYKPRENDELALEKADVVMVTQQSSDGWLEGMRLSDGERGWFPVQQVEFISNPEVCVRNLKEAQRVKTAKLQLVEQQT